MQYFLVVPQLQMFQCQLFLVHFGRRAKLQSGPGTKLASLSAGLDSSNRLGFSAQDVGTFTRRFGIVCWPKPQNTWSYVAKSLLGWFNLMPLKFAICLVLNLRSVWSLSQDGRGHPEEVSQLQLLQLRKITTSHLSALAPKNAQTWILRRPLDAFFLFEWYDHSLQGQYFLRQCAFGTCLFKTFARHWICSGQFDAQFGQRVDSAGALSDWLRLRGIGRRMILVWAPSSDHPTVGKTLNLS